MTARDPIDALAEADIRILAAMGSIDFDFRFLSFAGISEISDVDIKDIPDAVRNLARLGLVEYARGLLNEDGNPQGSGYGITDAGYAAIDASGGTKA